MTVAAIEPRKAVALLIVLFMVSFLFMIVTATSNALAGLKREIRLVDQKQQARWNSTLTNTLPAEGREEHKP